MTQKQDLIELRKTVENAGEAWSDGEHIDIITPPAVLELIERAEAAEQALDFHTQRDRELKSTLAHLSDQLDEHCYDEFASLIDDGPLDQWGESYNSHLEQAEQALARVSTMFEGVTIDHGNGVTENVNDSIQATIKHALDGEANE
ncbi:hypothetical protein [Glutamicibacter arilaitensis]|uniref:hypothetical protein n=1 Tax=Glutamicibacter arilaitensis TaxID=256701 RepID=UPI000ECF48B0|nr:hypothetical protein [Glutamicibacter sp.]